MNIINNKDNSINNYSVLSLCLIILISFINNFKFGGGISYIFPLMIVYIFYMILKKNRLRFNFMHILFFLWWLIVCISTIFSDLTIIKQDIISFLVSVIFVILVTASQFSNKQINYIIISYLFATILSSINIIYNMFINHQATWNRYSTSFFNVDKDPNYASAFILPGIYILLFLVLRNTKKQLFLVVVSQLSFLMILTVAVLATGSRGAFLFVIFSYVYNLAYALFSKTVNKNILIFIVLSIIFSLVYAFEISSNISFSLNRITTVSSYTQDTIRLELWNKSLNIFYDNPIIGVGLNGANDYLVSNGYHNSHNVFIDILTSGGLLGVIVFTTIIILITKVKKINLVFISGFLFVMLGPLFFINGFNTLSFWIPFFLVGIISNSLKHQYIEDMIKDFVKTKK